MKFDKKSLSNFVFIIFLGLILFTPVGFHTRVFVSRLLSFSPSVLDKEEQPTLSNYNWNLVGLDGKTVDFSDLEGKVILLNIWATWCPPCVAEMPNLHDLYLDYSDRVEFLMVANDEVDKVTAFLTKRKYEFPVYFESSTRPSALESKSIPTTFIIDKNGNIIVKKIGVADWNSATTREILENLLLKN